MTTVRTAAAFGIGLTAGTVTAVSLFALGIGGAILAGCILFVVAVTVIRPRLVTAGAMLVGVGGTWLLPDRAGGAELPTRDLSRTGRVAVRRVLSLLR
jgi:hypothetical protein